MSHRPAIQYRDNQILKLLKRYEPKDVAIKMEITVQQVYNARRRLSDRRKTFRNTVDRRKLS